MVIYSVILCVNVDFFFDDYMQIHDIQKWWVEM